MKKAYILFALFLFGIPAEAQEYNGNVYSFSSYISNHVKRDKQKVLQKGIASYSEFANVYGEDGTLKKSYIWRTAVFDTQGNLVEETRFSKNGKVTSVTTYQYNEKSQVISRDVKVKKNSGYKVYTWQFEYHNDTLLSRAWYQYKGKEAWGYRYFYGENNQLREQRHYEKGKLTGRIEFDYYPDLSKKEVRYYNDSVKLAKTFRYDCGIGNSLLSEKQKDTLTKCSRKEELPDGTIRTIEETRNEKGKIRRTVTTWNLATEHSFVEYYDGNNRLTSSYERTRINDNEYRVEVKHYHKGKKKPNHSLVQIEKKDSFGFYSWTVLEEEKVVKSYFTTYTFLSVKN